MFHVKHFGKIDARAHHTFAARGFVFWAESFVRSEVRRMGCACPIDQLLPWPACSSKLLPTRRIHVTVTRKGLGNKIVVRRFSSEFVGMGENSWNVYAMEFDNSCSTLARMRSTDHLLME
jgi:hypothetical protein